MNPLPSVEDPNPVIYACPMPVLSWIRFLARTDPDPVIFLGSLSQALPTYHLSERS